MAHQDFRFRNTLAHPIYLRAAVNGRRLNVSVWGRVPENGQAVTVPASDTGDEAQMQNS
jgi:vancomycin resistance protein YoaR